MDDTTFNALSYVWGDYSKNTEIILNEQVFDVGPNLHSALRKLRENGFCSWGCGLFTAVPSACTCSSAPGSDAIAKSMEFMADIEPKLVKLSVMEIVSSFSKLDYQRIL